MELVSEIQCSELWKQYEPSLRSLCQFKLRGHPEEIDDVISEVFFALCKKFEKNGPPENPKAWLYGACHNLINLKYKKMHKALETVVSLDENVHFLPYTVEFGEEDEDESLLEWLKLALEKELTEDEKMLVKLIYEDGRKMKDIAAILNSTESAVKQKHYRLCNKIRKMAKEKNNF